jgi:hypothetical protein
VVTRDIVAIPPVSEKMLADDVGYIQVDAFPEGKSQEIAGKIRRPAKAGSEEAGARSAQLGRGRGIRGRCHRQSFSGPRHDHLFAGAEVSEARLSTPIPPRTSPSFPWQCW